MKFIINNKLVNTEQTGESKACLHEIVLNENLIDGTRYRYCKKCGMLAHADNSYSYTCGSDYCKCSQ